jgi:hypothetical protein
LFTGTDGRLFAWALEGSRERDSGGRQQVRPLAWLSGSPGDERVLLGDLSVPTDSRLGGRVLVALRLDHAPVGTELEPTRLWWLQLDSGSSAIVRAGRLRTGSGEPPGLSERYPRVARTLDGRLILAYLLEQPQRAGWQLRVARVAIDAETGDPIVETVAERTLAEGCLAAAPVFSADTRWVSAVLRTDPRPRPLRRFAVGAEEADPHLIQGTQDRQGVAR